MSVRVAYGLVALSVVPLLGGAARLAGLVGADGMPNDARFSQSPLPVVAHIVAAILFSVLGAFQFDSGLRRDSPRWHRAVGRLLVACGLVTAASGVWMTLRYDIPPALQGPLLLWVRVVVGSAMAWSLVVAVRAIRRRDVPTHEAWMLRAYALAQGAGTQVFFLLAPQAWTGQPVTGTSRDLLMTAAWVFNLLVAEAIVRRRRVTPSRRDRGPTFRTPRLLRGIFLAAPSRAVSRALDRSQTQAQTRPIAARSTLPGGNP